MSARICQCQNAGACQCNSNSRNSLAQKSLAIVTQKINHGNRPPISTSATLQTFTLATRRSCHLVGNEKCFWCVQCIRTFVFAVLYLPLVAAKQMNVPHVRWSVVVFHKTCCMLSLIMCLVVAFGGALTTAHYAKSYRPFELFANENHKLRMN